VAYLRKSIILSSLLVASKGHTTSYFPFSFFALSLNKINSEHSKLE
jgi:hypothetical protein